MEELKIMKLRLNKILEISLDGIDQHELFDEIIMIEKIWESERGRSTGDIEAELPILMKMQAKIGKIMQIEEP